MAASEQDIAALPDLQSAELRIRWRKCYRAEPPNGLSRDLLIRGIAYKLQERAQGGLTQATKRKLRLLAGKLNTETQPRLSLKPGVKLVREWHSRTHTVTVLEDGFDYAGRRYRSLSSIARQITGARWSGPRFFGVQQRARASLNHG
jgi:hypothetical protein